MEDFFVNLTNKLNLFDSIVIILFIYCIVQCFIKGFSLSLISFMKWILSTVITIILVPKLQPIVSEYIDSSFINSVGLGAIIFILTLFIIILIGKALNRVVSVCLFTVLNWFYPYQNWGISAENAFTFEPIKKGSEILLEEFPSSDDFMDTKEKIEKI